ncbi:predicted protein [Nematostella vectensis]|uniref:phosphoribosylanthranilate isomerase n=1 Tax=Nematostella vectensis TaxID=45351 RepID=A7T441_NEMVE|nr:predicted protein [Nematostella vectensis]|eukprot:XP_001621370.1 hypothetical protein NEMVEDRAFT_v1g145157 [Nematostella vectensis]
MSTRVKICGITRLEDAQLAIAAGADALGFVFYEPSPRYVSPEVAAAIIRELPPFVVTTALFVDASETYVRQVLEQTQIDLLQFHGDETPAFCEQFNRPYIKALRVKPTLDLLAEQKRFQSARALLLDAYKPGVPGGTGESFDWALIPKALAPKIILAGGLDAGNVARAIAEVKPFAVDVSGGVEASKGIKDANKIKRFFEEVSCANEV